MADFTRPGRLFELRVPGFRAAGVSCGIKKNGKKDLAVIVSDSPAPVAGVFTTNKVKAAPVLLDMKRIRKGVASGIIVNSGNANACTGAEGMKAEEAVARMKINGSEVTIAGIAKGAGMICPNMATMLAFFLTDANIKKTALSKALKAAVEASFNSIIVDNDTSTNDTVLVLATGKGTDEIKEGTKEFSAFTGLLTGLAAELAHLIVKDGEGATRFVEIEVTGAASAAEAKRAARTVAESFLCKTAFFGGDPNWGRVMAAIGRAGVKMNEARSSISFNGVEMVSKGLDTGREKEAARAIKARELKVIVGLGAGRHSARVWTSDLTYEYVRINSAYRT